MSGFIHISHKTPVWQRALSGLCAFGAAAGVVWYCASDEGLPMAAPGSAPAGTTVPFVKAQPLPAPPPVAAAADMSPDDEQDATALASAAAALGRDADNGVDRDDYAARNAGIDVRSLTLQRPVTARTLLSEVLLKPGTQSGFVVAEVLPESRYERMGLKPGDVIYTLDIAGAPNVDENSMVALMQQHEVQLEVYRNGTLTRLHTDLAKLENADAPTAR